MKIEVKGAIVPNDEKWIYDWLGYDAVCPRDVNESINRANGESIDVYINSGGGDVFSGSEIYSSLREYEGQVNIHVVGLAASAASVVACAGKSDISPTGMIMVHNVSGSTEGDYHLMDKSSEILQQANRTIAAAYMDKTGMSEAQALKMMDSETWLTAADAVEKGLIDSITEAKNIRFTASAAYGQLPAHTLEKIRNTVKNPQSSADFFIRQKAQAQLNLLKLGG